jgi:hypothetical protein
MAVVTRLERKSHRWEQVWNGDAESVANIVAGRLEAEGIRTRVHGHTTPYRATALALGGSWAIMVPAGRAERARDILRENDEGHNVIEEDDGTLTPQQKLSLRLGVLMIAGVVIAVAAALVIEVL